MRCAIVSGIDALEEEACRQFLIRRVHPTGAKCPVCRTSIDGRQAETFNARGRVHCNSCGRWFGYRTETIFSGTTLNDRQIFLLLLLLANNCPTAKIAASCKVSEETVLSWKHKLERGSKE